MLDHELRRLIGYIRQIREWEEAHLPTYGTQAGHCLFLELACTGERKTLKEIYLSMPSAESTTRLLLRNLESDGWIQLTPDAQDQRFREFQPTEKFNALVLEWLRFVVSRMVQARVHLDPQDWQEWQAPPGP